MNDENKKQIDDLVAGLAGPVPADVKIPQTPDIAAALAVRSARIDAAIQGGLQTASERGLPGIVGFRLAVQSAVAGEIEHLKREILLELDARERRAFAAAEFAAGREHAES